MINLLPPDQKQALIFARRNTQLRKGVIGMAVGVGLILLVTAGNFFILHNETNSYRDNVASIEQELKTKDETNTIKRMNDISGTLNLVIKVLSGQVLFAQLFQQVGSAMPNGSILQNLALTGDMTTGVDLQIGSVDYYTGTQVLVNLQDTENKIFEKADLVSLTCAEQTAENGPYYCTGKIRATFQKDSQFSFLKQQTERAAETRSTTQ